jgi:hypothetical protein
MTHFAMMPRIAGKAHRQERHLIALSKLNPGKPFYLMGLRNTKVFLDGKLSETLPTGELPCRVIPESSPTL